MARYRKKQSETVEFLMNLYSVETTAQGRIEVRAKSPDGPVVAREFCATSEKVQAFADKYGTREQKLAVYYGVGKRIEGAKDGKKESVLSVPALWSDIDCGKHGWDFKTIVQAFHDLPGCLQPSALVHSGGGLHAYWLLDEPFSPSNRETVPNTPEWFEGVSLFENVNREFCAFTGGDNVFDISRVLRLPGTFNARRGKECHVIWFYRWHRHSLSALSEAKAAFDLHLGPNGFVPKEQLPDLAHAKDSNMAYRFASDPGKRGWESKHEAIWQSTRMGGGYPFYGLDEAQLLATAYLWAFSDTGTDEERRSHIVHRVVQRTKEIKQRDGDARDEAWDWEAEANKVRYKLDRWIVKWNYIEAARLAQKKADAAQRKADRKAAADGQEKAD